MKTFKTVKILLETKLKNVLQKKNNNNTKDTILYSFKL